jgi:3-hydroxyacyl-[acyl-carrier-protein] dehydratase
MPPTVHLDPDAIDCSKIIADRDAIRRVLPQRFEMEQLDAVVQVDQERHVVVGYKNVREDEFWVRGHLPGYPLLPGVLMCEAAAQLCSYYTLCYGLLPGEFIGFGGMENVRFRSPVRPGCRLLLVGKGLRIRRLQTVFNVQGFVGSTMVFHGDMLGTPMAKGE